jgi:hypothetical protein
MLPGGASSAPFSAKSGRRVNGAGLQGSVGGAPEAWTMTPGAGVVYDPAYASQGAWRFYIPSAVTGLFAARPGAGQSRIDLLVARIYDAVAIGSGPAEVKIELLQGQAAADPQPPTPPAGAIVHELTRFTVPSTGAITATQSTARTVAAGGILPVATTAERDKLKADGIAYAGLVVNNAQSDRLERYNGTAWKPVRDDLDVCMGLFWGAGYDPALHDHKTLSYFAETTTSAGANVDVIDLATQFVGVTGVSATPANGGVSSGTNTVRDLSPFLVGSALYLRAENSAGAAVIGQPVRFSVILHGWV